MYWNNGDRYEGDWINDLPEGKGIYFWKDGGEMVKKKEKELFIGMMAIDMKVIGEIIIEREKGLNTLKMVIEELVIFIMVSQ